MPLETSSARTEYLEVSVNGIVERLGAFGNFTGTHCPVIWKRCLQFGKYPNLECRRKHVGVHSSFEHTGFQYCQSSLARRRAFRIPVSSAMRCSSVSTPSFSSPPSSPLPSSSSSSSFGVPGWPGSFPSHAVRTSRAVVTFAIPDA